MQEAQPSSSVLSVSGPDVSHTMAGDSGHGSDSSTGSDVFCRGISSSHLHPRSVAISVYKGKSSASRRPRHTVLPRFLPRLAREAQDSDEDGEDGFPPRLHHLRPAHFVGGRR